VILDLSGGYGSPSHEAPPERLLQGVQAACATKKTQHIKHLLTFPGTVPKFLPEPLAGRI